MNSIEQRAINHFRELLSKKLEVWQIILFGSRARGDAALDSDMDILVILESSNEEAEEYVSDCAWEAGFDNGIVLVPVVYSKEAWENGIERFSLLARAIEREGIPL